MADALDTVCETKYSSTNEYHYCTINQPIFIRICEKRDWNTTHGEDKFFQRRDRLSNDVFKWNMPASELIFHGNLIRNKDWEC